MRKILSTTLILLFGFVPALSYGKDFSISECPVVGNVKSGIYHVEGCRNYEMMLVQNKGFDNRKCFNSRAEAESSGFRIAKNCKRSVYSK